MSESNYLVIVAELGEDKYNGGVTLGAGHYANSIEVKPSNRHYDDPLRPQYYFSIDCLYEATAIFINNQRAGDDIFTLHSFKPAGVHVIGCKCFITSPSWRSIDLLSGDFTDPIIGSRVIGKYDGVSYPEVDYLSSFGRYNGKSDYWDDGSPWPWDLDPSLLIGTKTGIIQWDDGTTQRITEDDLK